MIEKHNIKGTDIWIKVDAHPVERENPHIIPTEYFTASYYMQDPLAAGNGESMKDEEGGTRLFESPVAALTAARKHVENNL